MHQPAIDIEFNSSGIYWFYFTVVITIIIIIQFRWMISVHLCTLFPLHLHSLQGPIWGRYDPGGPHVGPMNFAIWGGLLSHTGSSYCPNVSGVSCLPDKQIDAL